MIVVEVQITCDGCGASRGHIETALWRVDPSMVHAIDRATQDGWVFHRNSEHRLVKVQCPNCFDADPANG